MIFRRVVFFALSIAALVALLWMPLPWTISTRVVHSTPIARPPAEVYRFVSTPAHWPRWHPSSLAVYGSIDHSLRPGEQVVEEFRVAGRRGEALWQVSAREQDRLWTIVGTINGRLAGQVTYRVSGTDDPKEAVIASVFEREFIYYAPNLLFVVLDKLKIHALVDDESSRAVANLKQVLEQPANADDVAMQGISFTKRQLIK